MEGLQTGTIIEPRMFLSVCVCVSLPGGGREGEAGVFVEADGWRQRCVESGFWLFFFFSPTVKLITSAVTLSQLAGEKIKGPHIYS